MKQATLSLLIMGALVLGGCGSAEKKEDTATTGNKTSLTDASKPNGMGDSGNSGKNLSGSVPSSTIVYFDFDRDSIRADGQSTVDANAQYLSNSSSTVRLEGHADERGSPEYNLALGQRRADSVKHALTILGVSSDKVTTLSYGEEKPANSGHNEAAWSENRRVEIVY